MPVIQFISFTPSNYSNLLSSLNSTRFSRTYGKSVSCTRFILFILFVLFIIFHPSLLFPPIPSNVASTPSVPFNPARFVLPIPSNFAPIPSNLLQLLAFLAIPIRFSPFFLQILPILQEKGQKAERFGRAVLGILLLQDIAVVPLLVLLPIIETQGGSAADTGGLLDQLALVGATIAKGVGGLGGILVAGRFLLRPIFDLVAGA